MVGDWCLMVDPVTIGFGCNKWLKDDDTEFMQLSMPDVNNNWTSCHDSTNTAFQVPVGKKLIILGMSYQPANSSESEFYITSHNVVDSSGGTNLAYWQSTGDLMDWNTGNVPMWAEIPAGYYLNCRGYAFAIFQCILTTV